VTATAPNDGFDDSSQKWDTNLESNTVLGAGSLRRAACATGLVVGLPMSAVPSFRSTGWWLVVCGADSVASAPSMPLDRQVVAFALAAFSS
jgi:hypothetical protein